MTTPQGTSTNQSGVRLYAVTWEDGQVLHLPSVTSIVGVAGEKGGLVSWAAKKVAEAAVAEQDWRSLDDDAAVKYLSQAHQRSSSDAARIGDEVHAAIEADVRGTSRPDVSRSAAGCLRSWDAFLDEHQPELVATEVRVVNKSVGYAGSLDVLMVVDLLDGEGRRPVVADVKTGKRLYPSSLALQMAAYANGERTIFGDELRPMLSVSTDKALALHLRPRSWNAVPVDISAAWTSFRHLVQVAAWQWVKSERALLPSLSWQGRTV